MTFTLNAVVRMLRTSGSRIACLRGVSGSGKTAVAKSVALSLDRQNLLSASFFLDKSGHRNGAASLDHFVTTLAAQLAHRIPWYRSAVSKIIFAIPMILNEPPLVQLDPLIIYPLHTIYSNKPELIKDSFIVIDGLEECGTPKDLVELMKLVARLEGLPKHFRFLLSCRSDFHNKHDFSPSLPLAAREDVLSSITTPPEDKHIASIAPDDSNTSSKVHLKIPQLWDSNLKEVIGMVLTGHTNLVSSVSFSPNGKRIASGSYDDTVRIWDAESGATIGEPLLGHTHPVNAVSFSPDGKRIVSGSGDRTLLGCRVEGADWKASPEPHRLGSVCSILAGREAHHLRL